MPWCACRSDEEGVAEDEGRDNRDHQDDRDGLVGDSWVPFGLFQERLCDVSVVLVVSVVSIWRWIRSVVCQLSEPRAAVIGAGYEVLCAESGRWGLLPQKADYLVLRFLAEDVVEKADAVLGTILGVIETGRVE